MRWVSIISFVFVFHFVFVCGQICLYSSSCLTCHFLYLYPCIFSILSLFLSHFLFLFLDAEVHYVNMTALTKGHLFSSFWVVDKTHFYIGSASMDWRSLATVSKTHHTPQHTHRNTHTAPLHMNPHLHVCILTQKQGVWQRHLRRSNIIISVLL